MKNLHSFFLVLSVACCYGQDYQITKFDIPVSTNNDASAQFLEDREGSVWLFSSDTIGNDLIMKLSEDIWEPILSPCDSCYNYVEISPEGIIYMAAGGDGLYKYEDDTWIKVLNEETYMVFFDPFGQLSVITDVGLGNVIDDQFLEANNNNFTSKRFTDNVITHTNRMYFFNGAMYEYCYGYGWSSIWTEPVITLGGGYEITAIEKDTNDLLIWVQQYTLQIYATIRSYDSVEQQNSNTGIYHSYLNDIVVDRKNVFWTIGRETLKRTEGLNLSQEWQMEELFSISKSGKNTLFVDSNDNCWALCHTSQKLVVLHLEDLDLVNNPIPNNENNIVITNSCDDDFDGDGHLAIVDCDDTNPNINLDQIEIVYNGLDDDCNWETRDDDLDFDGYNLIDDCDDSDPNVNPGWAEIPYNGIDNDCDPDTPFDDLDGDGYVLADDCDDMNPDINPSAVDIPNNGIDENCNGVDSVVLLAFPTLGWKQGSERRDASGGSLIHSTIVVNRAVRDTVISDTTYTIITQEIAPNDIKYLIRYDNGEMYSRNILVSTEFLLFDFSAEVGDTVDIDQYSGFAGKYIVESTEPIELKTGQIVKKLNVSRGNKIYSWVEGVGFQSMGLIPTSDFEGGGRFHICTSINEEVIFDETELEFYDCDFIDVAFTQDIDGDGVVLALDCDDTNPNINPYHEEVPYNGIDDDCKSWTPDDDLDGDGFVLTDDCDDNDFQINPDAEEIVNNGIDEDCDGMDLTSSIHELSNTKISIYPNPISDRIFIDIEGGLEYQTRLVDLEGRVISVSKNSSIINVTSLLNGCYLLTIEDVNTGDRVIKKLVK